MSTIQKVAVMIAGTSLVTALVLPGRQTPQVIGAIGKLWNGAMRTSQGFKA